MREEREPRHFHCQKCQSSMGISTALFASPSPFLLEFHVKTIQITMSLSNKIIIPFICLFLEWNVCVPPIHTMSLSLSSRQMFTSCCLPLPSITITSMWERERGERQLSLLLPHTPMDRIGIRPQIVEHHSKMSVTSI